jgi:hypothetical protein
MKEQKRERGVEKGKEKREKRDFFFLFVFSLLFYFPSFLYSNFFPSSFGSRCRLQWPAPGPLGAVQVPGAAFSFFGNFRSRKEAVERLRAGLQPSKNRKPHELELVSREAVVTASALE